MALTSAEKQKRYREKHPEKIRAYKQSDAGKASDKKYRDAHGTHPANKAGTEAYHKYRNSEKYRITSMRAYLKRNYDITLEQYASMLDAQGGLCKICNSTCGLQRVGKRRWPLFVDHDHKTGKIRGLLCHRCNMGIGFFSDDESLLNKAILYLKEN